MKMILLFVLALSASCVVQEDTQPIQNLGCEFTTKIFAIEEVSMATSPAEAEWLGLDLDEDGHADNGLGKVFAAWNEVTAAPTLSEGLNIAINDGRLQWRLRVDRCEGDGPFQAALFQADVTERFIGATGEDNRASGGTSKFPVAFAFDVLGDEADPGWLPTYAFTIDFDQIEGDIVGHIGMALGVGIPERAAPPIAAYTRSSEAGAEEFLAALDTNEDGFVTDAEVATASLITSLFRPDVDIATMHNGNTIYWPGQDGGLDHLSVGFGFRAVRVGQ